METSLTSKKCCVAKFCKVDAWSLALRFTGETSFSNRFFFNIPKILHKSKNLQNTSLPEAELLTNMSKKQVCLF